MKGEELGWGGGTSAELQMQVPKSLEDMKAENKAWGKEFQVKGEKAVE